MDDADFCIKTVRPGSYLSVNRYALVADNNAALIISWRDRPARPVGQDA